MIHFVKKGTINYYRYFQITCIALFTITTASLAPKSDVDAAIHIVTTAQIMGVGEPATFANGAVVQTDTAVASVTATQYLRNQKNKTRVIVLRYYPS